MNDTVNPRAAADQARAAYRNMTAELGHPRFRHCHSRRRARRRREDRGSDSRGL
jgi:hypothetical protein